MIDPRGLLTFYRVCEAGTISRAARALNLSQPSVSSAIASLEARLGVVLFERSRTGIVLTPEGEALHLRAKGLYHLLRDAEIEVDNARCGIAGPLQIGGTPGALVSLLPPVVAALDETGAAFAIKVIERPDAVLNDMLVAGEIELAFVTTEIEEPSPGVVEMTFSRDPFALIVGEAHNGLPDQVSLRDVIDLPWVLPEAQGAFRRQVDAVFLLNGIPSPRHVVRCDSLLTTKAIVRRTGRVTILPRAVVASDLAVGTLRAVRIKDAGVTRSIGVRRRTNRPLSPLACRFLEELASHP